MKEFGHTEHFSDMYIRFVSSCVKSEFNEISGGVGGELWTKKLVHERVPAN